MFLSVRSSGHARLTVGVVVLLLITAGWLCLAESHGEHDHALPHELCAGMVVVATTMLTAVMRSMSDQMRGGRMTPDQMKRMGEHMQMMVDRMKSGQIMTADEMKAMKEDMQMMNKQMKGTMSPRP